jgi:hypothetical protein
MLDVPVGVAHVRVPDDRVHPQVAGLHRRIPGAPTTGALRVILGAAGPRLRRRTGTGFGSTRANDPATPPHSRTVVAKPTISRLITDDSAVRKAPCAWGKLPNFDVWCVLADVIAMARLIVDERTAQRACRR